MALERNARPLTRCLRCIRHDRTPSSIRTFRTTPNALQETTTTESSAEPAIPPPSPPSSTNKPYPSPLISHTKHAEALLRAAGKTPIGSRRRRAALQSSANIPFSQLPYQCFQEARKVLQEDRREKTEQIEKERGRIRRLEGIEQRTPREEERLRLMRQSVEKLKLLADVNDPLVKKRFEDGMGDMTKPIYRHLADLKWRSYKRPLLIQRITQMNVTPDVLPHIDPVVSTQLTFPSYKRGNRANKGNHLRILHGDFVPSTISETPPSLMIQPYTAGDKLVTIAVVTPDVPNVEKDAFDYRCHFLASNIPISPTQIHVDLASLDADTQTILPWLPPYSQKGAPYQRHAIFVLEQPSSPDGTAAALDLAPIRAQGRYTTRENFILRSLVNKYNLTPIGVDLFRAEWDEGTEAVMNRNGIVGADVEFRRKRVLPLPYQRLKGERYR